MNSHSNLASSLKLFNASALLGHIPRTGYINLGIPHPESVSDHSFQVSIMAMVFAIELKANIEKVIIMALIHDIPEAQLGDIATPILDIHLSKKTKLKAEESILKSLIKKLPKTSKELINTYYAELQEGKTLESKIVHNADKLQMFLQLRRYENLYNLDSNFPLSSNDFWDEVDSYDWLPAVRTMLAEIIGSRKAQH